jgi:MoxR-like ATPase
MDHETAGELSNRVLDAISESVIADRTFLETTMTGILGRGHVLLEDVPGTGKTLTARSFARALDLSFQRIQFTPDLLPSDITGSNIYSEASGEFEFSPGPVFANVVLADEINRAPPKTQAALLEAMGEKQVTVDGETHDLPEPFFVIATQNPVEQEGTFGLPEAQRDRFMVKTSMGYPSAKDERLLLDRRAERFEQTPSVEPVIEASDVPALQRVPEHVDVDPRLRNYMVELGRQTRQDQRVEVGVSPRGIQRLFEASRAAATLASRDYVIPDDIKGVVKPVFTHRLVLTADASVRGTTRRDVLNDVLDSVRVPAADGKSTDQQRNQGQQTTSRDGQSGGSNRSQHQSQSTPQTNRQTGNAGRPDDHRTGSQQPPDQQNREGRGGRNS